MNAHGISANVCLSCSFTPTTQSDSRENKRKRKKEGLETKRQISRPPACSQPHKRAKVGGQQAVQTQNKEKSKKKSYPAAPFLPLPGKSEPAGVSLLWLARACQPSRAPHRPTPIPGSATAGDLASKSKHARSSTMNRVLLRCVPESKRRGSGSFGVRAEHVPFHDLMGHPRRLADRPTPTNPPPAATAPFALLLLVYTYLSATSSSSTKQAT